MPALSTAVLVGSLVSAGTQVARGVMGAKAAKGAAEIQTAEADRQFARTEAATREAKDYLEARRQESQTAYAPYAAVGGNALAALTRGMRLPSGMGQPAQAPAMAPPTMATHAQPRNALAAMPRSSSGLGPLRNATNQVVDGLEAQRAGREERMVLMTDPTGTRRRMVPERKVAQFRARGAQVVQE